MLSTINPPPKELKTIDTYQQASVLSTSSEQFSPQGEFMISPSNITKFFPNFLKKKRQHPSCFRCDADDCTLLFDTVEEYKKHIITHQNLIKCEYQGCNKQFINIVNLKKHYKSHFPSKKMYLCPYPGCNKSFTASYNLTIHYRIHKGDRPYECPKCDKKFFDRANYKYHVIVKHVDIKLEDRVCKHKGCNHISKTSKQNLVHHDKLELECKSEKNNLFNLLNYFISSIQDVLELKGDSNENFDELKKKGEFEKEIVNVEKQAKRLIESAIDKEQYNGIIGNY